MFIPLLVTTFLTSLLVVVLAVLAFRRPMANTLNQIASPVIGAMWLRYMTFALGVVGISGGVRAWDLEKYISPNVVLNRDRWVLEIYHTVIGTLSAIAWVLLVFFVVTLLAYVLVRLFGKQETSQTPE